MPSGAYFGDFSNNDARARWNAIFNSARQTGFAVCNGFALYSPSASQKLTDCNLICLGTFYPEASGGSDDGGVSMSNPTSSDRRSAFAKAVDSCSDRSEPGIDLDRSG